MRETGKASLCASMFFAACFVLHPVVRHVDPPLRKLLQSPLNYVALAVNVLTAIVRIEFHGSIRIPRLLGPLHHVFLVARIAILEVPAIPAFKRSLVAAFLESRSWLALHRG
jgi:hypothetical protein